ncbi:MAG: iron ABC transporter permease [Deltaproteobacteria bacterium]|nr:iron ABC transporter permease [Deltaproteobacteria bacterium]
MTKNLDILRKSAATLFVAALLAPAIILTVRALPLLQSSRWLAHLTQTILPSYLSTSLGIAVATSTVALLLGGIPAWVVTRCDFHGRRLVSLCALLPLLFPPYILAGIYSDTWSADFFLSMPALILALAISCSPFTFIVLRISFERIPLSFAEAAKTLGTGWWTRLVQLYIPLYSIPLVTALLLVAAESISDFGTAERVGIETFSVGLHNLWFGTNDNAVALLLSFIFLLPVILLVTLIAHHVTSRTPQNPVMASAHRSARIVLKPASSITVVVLSLLSTIPGFALPLFCTVRWGLRQLGKGNYSSLWRDMLNTLETASLVSVLTIVFCLVALLLLRTGHHGKWTERLPWLCLGNYFLPALVLALVFLMVTADSSMIGARMGELRDTRIIVVLAVALRLLPFAMLPMLDRLARIPPNLLEAARTLGLGPLRAQYHATFRSVWPALTAGAALVFIEAVKELTLSITLQPFGYSALALKIYGFTRFHFIHRASLWILLLQCTLIIPLLFLHRYLEREDK